MEYVMSKLDLRLVLVWQEELRVLRAMTVGPMAKQSAATPTDRGAGSRALDSSGGGGPPSIKAKTVGYWHRPHHLHTDNPQVSFVPNDPPQ